MKIETPLHTDHELDQLAGQFELWRQTRSHPTESIPQSLWDQAVALTTALPYSRVAKHLRLSPKDLKTRMVTNSEPQAACRTPSGFVELSPDTYRPLASSTTEIELQRKDGARLRLQAPDTALATIVKSFLEAR